MHHELNMNLQFMMKTLFMEHFFSKSSESFGDLFSESESAVPYCFENSKILTETEALYNKYMK